MKSTIKHSISSASKIFAMIFFVVFSFTTIEGNAQVLLLPWEPKFDSTYVVNLMVNMIVFDPNSLMHYSTYSSFVDSTKNNNKEYYINEKRLISEGSTQAFKPGKYKVIGYREFKSGVLVKESIYAKKKRFTDSFLTWTYKVEGHKVLFSRNVKKSLGNNYWQTKGYYHFNNEGLMDSLVQLYSQVLGGSPLFRGFWKKDPGEIEQKISFHYDKFNRVDSVSYYYSKDVVRHFYIDYQTVSVNEYNNKEKIDLKNQTGGLLGFKKFYGIKPFDSLWYIRLCCADSVPMYERRQKHSNGDFEVRSRRSKQDSKGFVLRQLAVYFSGSRLYAYSEEDLESSYYEFTHSYRDSYKTGIISFQSSIIDCIVNNGKIVRWETDITYRFYINQLFQYNTDSKIKSLIKK